MQPKWVGPQWLESGGTWSSDALGDTYTFTYPCGHGYVVPGNRMQMGGQVAPPICPTCHGQRVIDQMEAQNWNRDPKWSGYGASFTADPAHIKKINPSGPVAWLDYQIGTVRQRAWQ